MSSYQPSIENVETVSLNRSALITLGCDPAQAEAFANRKFSALPKWLRTRIKAASREKQAEPRKLNPKAGELAFYISPSRFIKR